MKKKIIILAITTVLLTGCVSTKVYNFERYLKDNNYTCEEHICTKENSKSKQISESFKYDINNNKYEYIIDYGMNNQKSTFIYNYETKLVAFNYKLSSIKFAATYDVDKEEYTCESNETDETYKSAECTNIKNEILEYLETVQKELDNSGYLDK